MKKLGDGEEEKFEQNAHQLPNQITGDVRLAYLHNSQNGKRG
jgi:hypothetical protein